MNIPAYYYAQQGADSALPHPGLGLRGWCETEVPVDPAHTAVIVMHAWRVPKTEGLYQHVEYLKRADKIMEERFPSFLQAVRQSGVRLIHVAAGFETALDKFPGYHRVQQECPPEQYKTIDSSPALQELKMRHWRLTGAEDQAHHEQIEAGYANYSFAIEPLEHEDVVTTANQLLYLCRKHKLEHLIYTGFAVNACLMLSPCGCLDMTRRGLICSIVGDLTTAVENKESCIGQRNLEYGLWQFSVQGGYVFLSDSLVDLLPKSML